MPRIRIPPQGYRQATKKERAKALKGFVFLRGVGLDMDGCLYKASRNLAAALKFAHHVGAGHHEQAAPCGHLISLFLFEP
jgi:hypothetical protein